MTVGAVATEDGDVVQDGDVVLLLSSTVWDPCDRVVVWDSDRVAKDIVTDGDADVDVDAERPSTVWDSVRFAPVPDEDGVALMDTDGE